VLGVDDALDRRAAVRAGLSVAAVDGHPLAERGHLLGKRVPGFAPQALGPIGERVARRAMEALDLPVVEARGELERREPRAVEELVRVGVPDPAEETRIGEGT